MPKTEIDDQSNLARDSAATVSEDTVRYARGIIIPDDDDDSHLADVHAVADGQTTVDGLCIVNKKR